MTDKEKKGDKHMMGNKTLFKYSINYGEYYGVVISTSKIAAKRKLVNIYGSGNIIGVDDWIGKYDDKDVIEVGKDVVAI